jgi:hypothetical protein
VDGLRRLTEGATCCILWDMSDLITIRVTGYSCTKLQAVKHICAFASQQLGCSFGLRGAKDVCDAVDDYGHGDFQIPRMPGVRLYLDLIRNGIDAAVVGDGEPLHNIELSTSEVNKVMQVLEGYASMLGMIENQGDDAQRLRRLANIIRDQA